MPLERFRPQDLGDDSGVLHPTAPAVNEGLITKDDLLFLLVLGRFQEQLEMAQKIVGIDRKRDAGYEPKRI